MRTLLAALLLIGTLAFVGCGDEKPKIGDNTKNGSDVVDTGNAGTQKKSAANKIDPKDKK